jgi:polyribonucleotide nucleotidyltransferase
MEKAKELICAVIEFGPVVALGMETIKMDCPADKVPLVIGIKGMTAKEMMRRTGCKIHVNETAPEGSTMCSIELTGTTEQIEQATKIISHVLEFGTKALGKRFQRTFQKGDSGGGGTLDDQSSL